MPDEILTRTAITVASTVVVEPIKHLLNTWLKPKLEEIKERNEINSELKAYAFEVFSEYLNRTYKAQNSINVIALGLQQVRVDQIYIPLTIYSVEKQEKILLDEYKLEFADKFKKIVIEDTAGMGKSTLMKRMFISVIEGNKGIPIFIELRNLTKEKDIVDVIVENINALKAIHSKELIIEIINRGDFIFFLDGYDEIPFQDKQEVTKKLKDFILRASNSTFFLTSRPDDSLTSFGEFQKFEIQDLDNEEAYELIKKYDDIVQLNLYNPIVEQIKENIDLQKFSELESFLGNPLLVSFLYLTFKHKKDIPAVKIEFYSKVYDALFELHDLSKDSFKRDKYSQLSSGGMKKILNKLGFLCLTENVNDYDKNKILKLITQAKNNPYFKDIQEEHILKDLLETVPLFTTLGLSFKWAHKSFMEYFAAYFIDRHDEREKILNNIYKSSNFSIYLNMLDLYYDIDRQMFDKVFVYPIIEKFINYISNYRAIENVDSQMLQYLETWFNRAVIYNTLKDAVELPDEAVSWEEKEIAVKKVFSGILPNIDDYNLKAIAGGSGQTFFLVEDQRIEHILLLLANKKSKLVKVIPISRTPATGTSFVSSYKTPKLEVMNKDELSYHLDVYGEYFGLIPGSKTRKLEGYSFAINYSEALKYKELIEEGINLEEEENLYINL